MRRRKWLPAQLDATMSSSRSILGVESGRSLAADVDADAIEPVRQALALAGTACLGLGDGSGPAGWGGAAEQAVTGPPY